MFTIHEGEIINKEMYGSTPVQRFYVKPPDQTNISVLDGEKRTDLNNLFKRIFLPQGYPESVSKDYISYQIWDTAQAFCSTITGILATQEVFRGVGVGDTNATPLAATVTWVLKDGCGHLGKIFFAYSRGTHLDAYSKKWRLYADVLNDVAMCIEIALPAFKNHTTVLLCVSTVMKAIVGVAGGATRAAMTQHHAIRGNLADVSAKDSAQETAVNLVASITALFIITLFGNSLSIFIIMMVFHIIFNYLAVRAVCLRTLNEPRMLQIIDSYLRKEIIANPCAINKNEPIIFYQMGPIFFDRMLCGFHIKTGRSMKNVIKENPKAYYIKNVQEIYKKNQYILLPSIQSRKLYILLRDSARSEDVLRAYFHAVLFAITICAINNYHLAIYKSPENKSRPFTKICETLQQVEWSREPRESPNQIFNYEPSFELMSYMNRIVRKEWPRLSHGLKKIGWDLNKHLLIVDEWRICTARLVARHISAGENNIPEDLADSKSSAVLTFGYQNETFPGEGSDAVKTYTIEPDVPVSEKSVPDSKTNQNVDTKDAKLDNKTSINPTTSTKNVDTKSKKKKEM